MSVGGGAGRALIDLTGPKPGVARTLTGSMVREPSAYSLRSVQEVLSELERKGEGRTRQARSFKDKLRRAMEGKVSTSEILRLAKRQLPRLERVKITDKMRRLK